MEVEETKTQRKFVRPSPNHKDPTPDLFVANCGPAVGLSLDEIASLFASFGTVVHVRAADDSGARVIVSYSDASSAEDALTSLNGLPCPSLHNRVLSINYSVCLAPSSKVHQINDSVSVSLDASELGIPGLYLLRDFVSTDEERELLVSVDARPWKKLAKRRVQHYGYEFFYLTRNVNNSQFLGELPSFVSPLLKRISLFPNVQDSKTSILDQLTVNEYPPGVGLSPHIDTHSAFDELIFSLSLAGPCVMEFRKYAKGTWLPMLPSTDIKQEEVDDCSDFMRRAIFLPPRSMLLLSGEARYAWHHYITHHKVDMVGGHAIKRGSRRISFTLRKVRVGPCCCEFPEYCDSQRKTC
ncbi:alkylated DNA repair protein ALKBH8 homolog [Aristolochia californica]|uniref:alkylated DNA repair protein ALKBH8 homolog n=1 Tax=Aristolochia californica TaxID=171875 RepID=UPI0035E050A4